MAGNALYTSQCNYFCNERIPAKALQQVLVYSPFDVDGLPHLDKVGGSAVARERSKFDLMHVTGQGDRVLLDSRREFRYQLSRFDRQLREVAVVHR